MAIYKKKPVEVEAFQITEEAVYELLAWAGEKHIEITHRVDGSLSGLLIWTLEGHMTAKIGDYLIRGVKGEFYACDKEIFEITYELVREDIPVLPGEYDY